MLAQGPGHHFGPNALSGSSVYELTFDGYRPVLRVTDRGAELWLRIGFDLSAVSRTSLRLPRRICLAVWSLTLNLGYGCARLCFDHLQQRMTARAVGVAGLARQRPATFIAFDLLSVRWGGFPAEAVQGTPRRTGSDRVVSPATPTVTVDQHYATARHWFATNPASPGRGLMAEGAGSARRPNTLVWTKIKPRENLNCVIGALVGPIRRPEAVVAGRSTTGGMFTIVGHTALSSVQSSPVAAAAPPAPVAGHPWPSEISCGNDGGALSPRVAPTVVVESAPIPR